MPRLFAHRPRVALSALLGVLLLPALPAQAQIQAQILSFEGRTSVDLNDIGTQTGTPVNLGECLGGAVISWRFTMVDQTRANLAFFSGSGCDDASIRNDTVNASCVDLGFSVAIENRSQVDVDTSVDQLIDCDGTSGIDTIWALALDQPQSEVTAAGQSASFPLAFDFDGPPAPSGLSASDGEAGTRLTWDSSNTQIREYEVYRVAGGCAEGEASVDLASASPVDTPDGNISSYDLDFPEDDPVGTEYAVAVRALDQSMNPSDFSNVRCVRKVNVDSFFEMYCLGAEASADACTGSGCAISAGDRPRPAAALLFLLGLGALLYRRSR